MRALSRPPAVGPLIVLPCLLLLAGSAATARGQQVSSTRDYYYTRTRANPQHLRVSEEFKNDYVNDLRYEQRINGTTYHYYKAALPRDHDQLVFETIDKIFRHRLSPFYIHHYDNDQDRRDASDPRRVSQDRCARDLMYLVDKLPTSSSSEESLSPELSALFDSYGRPEAGLLMGNTYWVGAYDQCVNRHIFELTDAGHLSHQSTQDGSSHQSSADSKQQQHQVISFEGRYCVASLRAPAWDAAVRQRQRSAKNYFKTQRQLDDYSRLFRLQLGLCLPSSCDSTTLDRHHAEIRLLATHLLPRHLLHYDLIDLYCLPDEASPLRSWRGSALYFVIFAAVWCLLLVAATLADLCGFAEPQANSRHKRLRKCAGLFSLRANFRKLWKVSQEEEQQQQASSNKKDDDEPPHIHVNLRFLNAFKALVMFWIVNGHIMLLMIQTAKNILYSDALLNGLMHFLIGATFGVDLFFTMTGFLTAYLIFNSGHAFTMKPLHWLYLSFHRYWRLAPMYFLAFWFSRSVAQQLGSGPLWDYGTSALTFRGLCNHESWWYPLTLTSNLHGLFEECMITSWYISCDMQFWLASPLFIHLLAKKPTHGWVAALSAILMSSKARFDAIAGDKSARYDELVQPRADIFMRVSHDLPALYTHPQHRISAYLVGLLAGHYVYMVKTGRWRSPLVQLQPQPVQSQVSGTGSGGPSAPGSSVAPTEPSSKARTSVAHFGVFAFLVMAFISYLLNHYYPSSLLGQAPFAASLAHSVGHLVMSIGASLIITCMCFGQWPRLARFLSAPAWTRLSKLNYALLLLQCEAIYFQIFRYDQVPVAGTKELINILFNLLVSLYPAAFALTLALEYPLANLEKLLH